MKRALRVAIQRNGFATLRRILLPLKGVTGWTLHKRRLLHRCYKPFGLFSYCLSSSSLLMDVFVVLCSQASRYYFDHIIIHPMKITLSFVNTSGSSSSGDEDSSLMNSLGGTAVAFIKNMATVDRSPIRYGC